MFSKCNLRKLIVRFKMENQKNYPLTVRVPFSVLDFIDEIIDNKLNDGENKSTANRTAIALEILKIGARVLKKKMKKAVIKMSLLMKS